MMEFSVEEAQRLVGELTIQGRILARELAEAKQRIRDLEAAIEKYEATEAASEIVSTEIGA